MERITRLLALLPRFMSPRKPLLIDFWTEAEESRSTDENAFRDMASTVCSLRPSTTVRSFTCTEQQIWEMPRALMDSEYDGVILLPPLTNDRGSGDILSALHTRQQFARPSMWDQKGLFTESNGQGDPVDELAFYWCNASLATLRQRDLRGFVIATILPSLPHGTPVTIISDNSLLRGGTTRRLRESIAQLAKLDCIVELGGHWPGIYPDIELVIITMQTGTSGESLVRMFKTPVEGNANLDKATRDLQSLVNRQGGTTAHGYILRSGIPFDGSWLVESHHPRWEQYRNSLNQVGDVKLLGELGELRRFVTAGPNRVGEERSDFPVLSSHQMSHEGIIDVEDAEYVRYYPPSMAEAVIRLTAGDVLIRELNTVSGSSSFALRVGVMPSSNITWCLGNAMILLRFREEIDSLLRDYLLAYLRSPEVAAWLYSRTPGTRVNTRELQQLPVPMPDRGTLNAFGRLRQSYHQFNEWSQQLRSVEQRLFAFDSIREARQQLLEVSAWFEQRIAMAKATDTLSWRIRNLYPHPLAFRWRSFEILDLGVEKYQEILRAAEVCVSYAAIVGCVLNEVHEPGSVLSSVATFAGNLKSSPGKGVTFGTWATILQEVNGSRLQDIDPNTPFIETSQVYALNTQLRETINRLMSRRNDYAHDRGPSASDLPKSIAEAGQDLETLYDSLGFLSRYHLRNILLARRVGRQHRGTYVCEDLVSDHPIPDRRNIAYEGETPAVGLHLVDPNGVAHYVEPLLIRRQCPVCRKNETFILDRYMRNGDIMYKSLEYGHEIAANETRESLRQFGIDLPALA